MPNVTSSGTYTKASAGFEFLAESIKRPRLLMFAGTSIGGGCTIQVKDDTGTFNDVTNGDVSSLPTDTTLITDREVQLVFTGSPNCNVSCEYVKYV